MDLDFNMEEYFYNTFNNELEYSLPLPYGRKLGDIRRLESVARMHQDKFGVQILLCVPSGRDVRQRNIKQRVQKNRQFQPAHQTQARQKLENRKRTDCVHVLHLRLFAQRCRRVAFRMLADDEGEERPVVLLFHQTHRPFYGVCSRRLGRGLRQCARWLHRRESRDG